MYSRSATVIFVSYYTELIHRIEITSSGHVNGLVDREVTPDKTSGMSPLSVVFNILDSASMSLCTNRWLLKLSTHVWILMNYR